VTAFRLAARDFRSTAAVGARLRAMLLLGRVQGLQSKSFRLPSAAESLSLCVAKEKVTQEKGHPDGAPCGHPALRVRGWATGFFDSTSCAGEKLAGILAGHPAGFPSPTRRAIGAPGRAARSRRALFEGAGSRAEAKSEQSTALLWLSLFAFRLSTECGPGWPAALPGVPCAAVSRGRQAAQREPTGMSVPFRTGRMPVRKARPRLTDLPGRMPGKRQAGCRFLLVTSLLDKQKRSNSASAGGRKLLPLRFFALNAVRARASRTECAPTVAGGRKFFAIPSANRNTGTFA
jgi:hypothetical protein